MKMRFFFVVSVILAASIAAAAQVKTVTNSDLIKYRLERVMAEKELRENFAKLGFSSPAELARRNAESAKETQELSTKLRSERLIREQAAAEIERQRAEQARYAAYIKTQTYSRPVEYNYWNYSGYGYGYGYDYGYGWPVRPPRANGITWRADGSGVVYEPGGRSSNIWTPVIGPGRRW